MISCFLCCPLPVVQNVYRLLKFVLSPSNITRGYCHGDHSVNNWWKITAKHILILLHLSPIVTDVKINYQITKSQINITAVWNKYTSCYWQEFPPFRSKASWDMLPVRSGWETIFCEIVQTWLELVHNPRAGMAPISPIAVIHLQDIVRGPKTDAESGC